MANRLFNTDLTVSGIIDATQVHAETSLTVSGIPVATSTDVSNLDTRITDNYNEFVTASGHLQSQISNLPASSGQPALVGADGITVTSGVSTITIAGFRSEFVAASGSLQSQINNFVGTSASFVNQTTVILTHNFNTNLYATTVVDTGGNIVEGSVQQALNDVTISFNQGQSGTVIVTR